MSTYLHSFSISEKVSQLQSALFINDSESVLKIPNQIVKALYTDEIGQIWFTTKSPFQSTQYFNKQFPSHLDFFKKEAAFFLKISGNAFVVNDPEEINNLVWITENTKEQIRNEEIILLKLYIQNAEYFEKNLPEDAFSIPKIKNKIYKWMSVLQNETNHSTHKKLSWQNLIHIPNLFSN